MRRTYLRALGVVLGSALLAAGCAPADRETDRDVAVEVQPAQDTLTPTGMAPLPAPGTAPGQQDGAPMRIEVDIAARQLHVYRDGQRTETHPVAVGSSEWPTRTGEWTIGQVVWNPRWVPPEEAWAEDEEPTEPGDPDNPLGVAQLIYDAPRTIHGTNEPSSVGQAVSHGSIRVTNEVAAQLARQAMEAGGAPRDEAWFRRVQDNRTRSEEVTLSRPIPIRVHDG